MQKAMIAIAAIPVSEIAVVNYYLKGTFFYITVKTRKQRIL